MALRSVTYFKADTLADLAQCEPDAIVLVAETGKQYFYAGGEWSTYQSYPVGALFTTTEDTNPATLLGYGTWEAFGAGRTLVGIDAAQTEFDAVLKTGGAKTHTLTTPEMPAHTHLQDAHTHLQDAHNHTQNAHTHLQDAHNHLQNAHTHVQDAHSHTEQLQGGTTGATGGTNIMGSTATGGSLRRAPQSTLAQTATNQNATAVNQAQTATNQNATAVNNAQTATNQNTTAVNQNAGGGGAHNNLQPFIVVYFWRRTA